MAEFFEGVVAGAVATTAEIFDQQGTAESLVLVLRAAKPSVEEIGPDGWNDEVMRYQLNLEVPVSFYSALEDQLDNIEEAVLAKIRGVLRRYRRDSVESVVITPILDSPMTNGVAPPANAADHIWDAGMLRLFISHVSAYKVEVGQLKWDLATIGISGFVAHEDIEPSSEWEDGIVLALRTAQAAAALLTPDFHDSKWTDQEMGAAMARGVVVIPVKLGMTPYGFVGRYQAMPGSLDRPEEIADRMFTILSQRPSTLPAMREGLVAALERANTFKAARKVTRLLGGLPPDFSQVQKNRMTAALAENGQVSNANGVPEALERLAGTTSATRGHMRAIR